MSAPLYSQLSHLISGGQTGVDWSVHDVLRRIREIDDSTTLTYGGYVPSGRRRHGGAIPSDYDKYVETPARGYGQRTHLNVATTDGTLIICPIASKMTPGTAATYELVARLHKPLLVAQLSMIGWEITDTALLAPFIIENKIRRLNIAGPSEHHYPSVCEYAADWLYNALTRIV